MQQVVLAYQIVLGGRARLKWWKGDRTVFGQLVHVIAGEQDDIETKDRVASQSHEAQRLRRSIERFKSGDIPQGTLYGGRDSLDSLAAAHVGAQRITGGTMPYRDGKRVSNEEWSSGGLTQLHTGPRGENPGEPFTVEAVEGSKGGDQSEDSDKMVYGVEVIDKADTPSQEIDAESVASDSLSGDTPGEGSGESRDLEAAGVDEDEDDEPGLGSAVEAEADFVEDAKPAAKAKAKGKSK